MTQALPVVDHSTVPLVFAETRLTSIDEANRHATELFKEIHSTNEGRSPKRLLPREYRIGQPLEPKVNHIQFPHPRETWIVGGNPRNGIVNVPQKLRVVSRPLNSKMPEIVFDQQQHICGRRGNEIVGDHSHQTVDSLTFFPSEAKDMSETKMLGRQLASGLQLRLISTHDNKEEPHLESTEEFIDSIPTAMPIQYKVKANEDDSCDIDFTIQK